MSVLPRLLALCAASLALVMAQPAHAGGSITIAAAADLKFAMEEIVTAFRRGRPDDKVEVIYGSSGKFHTQIQQGAPYDLYFSADIAFPRGLERAGHAAGPTRPYAVGRLVLWSKRPDADKLTLTDLTKPGFKRIAIANPRHAPYGRRAEEALRAVGVWGKIANRLVLGENIAQTAQFVQTGNAQVGLIALSLALSPALAAEGSYALIDDTLHAPLEQGFIVTRRAADNPVASAFADFMGSTPARTILRRYGFELPREAPSR